MDDYKVYGESDADLAAENLLREHIKGKDVLYLILNQRIPSNARPCKLPGSLTVQAVMADRTVVSVRQYGPGGRPRIVGG